IGLLKSCSRRAREKVSKTCLTFCLQASLGSFERFLRRSPNQKLVQFLAGAQLSRQPARLFATTGPSFLGIVRIAIFGKNPRIWTPLWLDVLPEQIECRTDLA